jgi:hypothetical protein
MKLKYLIISILMTFVAGFYSCKEEPVGQQPVDSEAPGTVSDVKVKNTPGGAILTYTLPGDEDLLYVKAVYSRKSGEISESRSSLYTDTLKVEGFGDMQEREVKLIAVDRSRNESPAVSVKINPLEPVVTTIGKSLNLIADFGGVHAYWDNPTRAEVSVTVLLEDSNQEYVPLETFYSSMIDGQGTVRGMDTISAKFGIFVRDYWGNTSEVKYYEYTPIYETLFDRLKFRDASLPNDGPHYGGGWVLPNIWNGIKGADEGYSSGGGSGIWPQSITVDLGVTGQISRVRLYQRMGSYTFAEGNPRLFEVWGCENLDISGSWDSWTKLMDCESIKPSGLALGQNSNEDETVAREGEDFVNSPSNPKVRYIRLKVLRTWAGGDNFQICEIEVFGDNR